MNVSAFHYSGAKTRLTDVRHLSPGAVIVQCRQFLNILKKLPTGFVSRSMCQNSLEWLIQVKSFYLLLWMHPESWIFTLLIEINKKRKNPETLDTFKKTSSQTAVHSRSLWWWQHGSYEGLVNFLLIFMCDFLFMCAAMMPCCYDCSPLGQTGPLISLFMQRQSAVYHSSSSMNTYGFYGCSHVLQHACSFGLA